MLKKTISKLFVAIALFATMTVPTFAHNVKYVDSYYKSYDDYYSNNYHTHDYGYDKYDKYDKYGYYDKYNDYRYDDYRYDDYNYYNTNNFNNFNIDLSLNLDPRSNYVVQPFIYDIPTDDLYLWAHGFGYPSSYYFFPPFYYHGY